jgi:hypothetical protein
MVASTKIEQEATAACKAIVVQYASGTITTQVAVTKCREIEKDMKKSLKSLKKDLKQALKSLKKE